MHRSDLSDDVSQQATNPQPLFLGFCPKEYQSPPKGWGRDGGATHVTEICSVAECIASRPPWIDRWDFNRATCWDTEAAAWACVPVDEQERYHLFAYWAIPVLFDTSGAPITHALHALFPIDLPNLPLAPDLSNYACLGYDIVQYEHHLLGFGCSPLSCNALAHEHPVNRFCLLDRLDVAYATTKMLGTAGGEPGPYLIIEVRRRILG